MSSTERLEPENVRVGLLRQAQLIATRGDRWFVSLAQGLGRIGSWVQREVGAAAGSTMAAVSATVSCQHGLPSGAGESVRPSEHPSACPGSRFAPSASRGCAPCRLDVLSATSTEQMPGELEPPRSPLSAAPDEAAPGQAGNPPGVLPLVQALGLVVADHHANRYVALAADERFWALVQLLDALGGPGSRPSPSSGTDEGLGTACSEPKAPRKARPSARSGTRDHGGLTAQRPGGSRGGAAQEG